MSFVEVILIAFSLSLDAFAVSISSGGTMKFLNIKNTFKMAFFFGFFHSIMPVIGYLSGHTIEKHIGHYNIWIASGILLVIGIKMIYESFKLRELNCGINDKCPFNIHTLTILAFATSIDALSIGITFSVLNLKIFVPVIIIVLITFLMSIFGIYIGYKGRHFFENKMETIAGIILILIGLKILFSN